MGLPPNDVVTSDVVVIGGGLAGLSTSIHLLKAGLSVVCLEPQQERSRIVGESLDWSGPELLRQLGLEMQDLVADGIATYKKHVTLNMPDGSRAEYVPSEWLGESPFNIELRTLHVDRLRLDARVRDIALQHGLQQICDRAVETEWAGRRLKAIVGESGRRYEARWFVDASGYAGSFLGRQLNIPTVQYGPKKVGIWSYFDTPNWQEGTTLYAQCEPGGYLQWMWQIPIAPGETSVGLVISGPMLKQARARGESVADVFRGELERTSGLRSLAGQAGADTPAVTSFSCRAFKRVCGENWLIAGEAAAVPDPITGNGVTGALRHATEGAHLVVKYNRRGRFSWLVRQAYSLRVRQMCQFFDSLIERLAYSNALRDRFGLKKTGDIYTAIAWSMNHLYSRFGPSSAAGSLLFCTVLTAFRAAGWTAERVCDVFGAKQPRPAAVPKAAAA